MNGTERSKAAESLYAFNRSSLSDHARDTVVKIGLEQSLVIPEDAPAHWVWEKITLLVGQMRILRKRKKVTPGFFPGIAALFVLLRKAIAMEVENGPQ
jgi:hypothetical protein